MAERCDGIPWGVYTQHSYNKVTPQADGLYVGYNPEKLLQVIIEQRLVPVYKTFLYSRDMLLTCLLPNVYFAVDIQYTQGLTTL